MYPKGYLMTIVRSALTIVLLFFSMVGTAVVFLEYGPWAMTAFVIVSSGVCTWVQIGGLPARKDKL